LGTQRFVLGLEYDGASFSGWQTQPDNVNTVQDALERALSTVANEPIATVCAGRTDAGVHALGQVVHFDSTAKRPLTAWVRGANAHLPDSVSVLWARSVNHDFHARFGAIARHYRYMLLNRAVRPGLLSGRTGWHHRPLALKPMQAAAEHLLGQHDFSSFRDAQCQAKNPVRNMLQVSVTQHGDLYCFDFSANAFLHHMVRNMVGSLIRVGLNEAQPQWIAELLQQRDRRLAAPTAAPHGLYFVGPDYAPGQGIPARAPSADALLVSAD